MSVLEWKSHISKFMFIFFLQDSEEHIKNYSSFRILWIKSRKSVDTRKYKARILNYRRWPLISPHLTKPIATIKIRISISTNSNVSNSYQIVPTQPYLFTENETTFWNSDGCLHGSLFLTLVNRKSCILKY